MRGPDSSKRENRQRKSNENTLRGCATSLALGSILTAELPGWDLRRCESVSPEDIAKLMGGLKPEQQHVGQLGAELVRRLAKNYRNGVLDDDTPIPAR